MPDVDATVVTRILDEGGEIIGKAVCEDLCFSGGSFTSATGPVRNPHNPAFNAGGSSSGSTVLVVNGDCDMAMGGDQGGSIRIPSSWSRRLRAEADPTVWCPTRESSPSNRPSTTRAPSP